MTNDDPQRRPPLCTFHLELHPIRESTSMNLSSFYFSHSYNLDYRQFLNLLHIYCALSRAMLQDQQVHVLIGPGQWVIGIVKSTSAGSVWYCHDFNRTYLTRRCSQADWTVPCHVQSSRGLEFVHRG